MRRYLSIRRSIDINQSGWLDAEISIDTEIRIYRIRRYQRYCYTKAINLIWRYQLTWFGDSLIDAWRRRRSEIWGNRRYGDIVRYKDMKQSTWYGDINRYRGNQFDMEYQLIWYGLDMEISISMGIVYESNDRILFDRMKDFSRLDNLNNWKLDKFGL